MTKYLLAGGAMLAVVALHGPLARAATESTAEEQAFSKAKVSLSDAIKAAEQNTQGKVLGIEFDERQQQPTYTARILHNGKEAIVHVNANCGQVMGQPTKIAKGKLDSEDKAEGTDLQNAKVTLTDAVKTAEQKTGGKAMDAQLTTRQGKPVYEVEVAHGGQQHGHGEGGPEQRQGDVTITPGGGGLETRRGGNPAPATNEGECR